MINGLTLPSARQTEFAVVASVAIFVAGMACIAVFVGGEDIWRHLKRLDASLLASLLVLSLLNYAARTLRWHLYSRHLDLPVSLLQSSLVYVAGFSLTTTPGRVGEALRLWLLDRIHGLRYDRTLPLLVADRVSDMGAVGLLLIVGLAGASAQPLLLLAAILASSGMLLLAFWPSSATLCVGALYRALGGRWRRLFGTLRGTARRTAGLFTPILALSTLLLAVIGWMAECVGLWLVLHTLGVEIGLLQATLVFTAGMLVGALTFVPGGLGGTEGTMLALLGLFGVPMAVALPATLISRVTTLWFAVGLGFLVTPTALRLARGAPA